MQKEKFQQYLYNQESLKSADISELIEVLNEYPWFSTASIILLVSSKLQSKPEFDKLLKKHSFNITDRKLLSKLLHSGFDNSDHGNEFQDNDEPQELHSRITGIFDSIEMDITGVDTQSEDKTPGILSDDSLLDFSYPARRPEVENLGVDEIEIVSERVFDNKTEEEEISEKISDQNFDHWLEKLGSEADIEKSPYKKHQIIESFIHSDPGVIRADKVSAIQGDVSKESAEENEGFITDTLAKIYVKQGLYNKAIYAYEKLCLKYPEKSIYFASQIEEIRNLYTKK